MSWVVPVVWLAAVLMALVILGFCAYEIRWKLKRLHADLDHLAVTREHLTQLQREVTATQARVARVRVS